MTYCFCARCKINFTSESSFEKHLKPNFPNGYIHLSPEECGLVETPRGISLPPPVRPIKKDEWAEIFKKEEG